MCAGLPSGNPTAVSVKEVLMDTIRRPEQLLHPPALATRCWQARRMASRILPFVLIVPLSLSSPFASPSLSAQDTGILAGIVRTPEKKPLALAKIRIVGTPFVAEADTDGAFRIRSPELGSQTVEVKLLGYASILIPVQIEGGKTTTLNVILEVAPAPLETVKISGDTLIVPAMAGFMERRARGNGKFFTREEIDRMQARLFTDVLRRVPGMQMQLVTGGNNNNYTVRTSRNQEGVSGGRQCPVMFYMNGMPFPMTSDGVINSFIGPEEVEAVEVYTGTSQIPPQFNSTNARCGVVVIWTLNGKESRHSRSH